ncbi:MAG: helix-turn-helix domain-containing protein [Bacillota bacterium]
MPRKEKYYNYFDEGLDFDEISKKLNVKESTIYDHFFNYMLNSDISQYEDFILDKLPLNSDIAEIVKMAKENMSFGEIKYRVDKRISFEQIRIVYNLSGYYKSRETFRQLKLKNKKNDNFSKDGLFGFLEYRDQNKLKVEIDKYLNNAAFDWSNDGEIVSTSSLNRIDRMSLAENFLEKDEYNLVERYKYKFKVNSQRIIEDIAKQIDFEMPKYYYLKKKNLDFGYKDYSKFINGYKGIHKLSGIKYKFVENYIRDELFVEKKDYSYVDFQNDIIPYVESQLNDYGFTFKIPKHKLDEKICLLILHYLWYEDNSEEVFNYIDYEI